MLYKKRYFYFIYFYLFISIFYLFVVIEKVILNKKTY